MFRNSGLHYSSVKLGSSDSMDSQVFRSGNFSTSGVFNLEAIENRRAECGLSLSCEPYIGNSNRPDELGFVEDVCLSCEKYVSNIWMYKQETKAKFHLPSRTPTLTWKLCKFVFLLMQKFHPQVPAAGHRREPVRFFGGRSSICFTGWDSCIICWRR